MTPFITRRRATAALLCLATAVPLAGCGGSDSDPGAGGGGGKKEVDLAMAYWTSSRNAFKEMDLGARAVARETPGVNLTESAPSQVDGNELVNMFQAATRTSKDGIALQSLAGDLFTRPVQQATEDGIPVVAVDAPVPGTDLLVSNDNEEIGRLLVTEIVKEVPKDATGEVVIGNSDPGVVPLEARVKGMKTELAKVRPGLKVVGPLSTHGRNAGASENYDAWNGILRAHPDAVAYLAPSNTDAASLTTIQRRSGKKLLVGGCDLENAAVQGVADGYVRALVSPEHFLKGYIALKLLADHAQKGTALPKGMWNSGELVVNKDNVQEIIARQKSEAARQKWFDAEAKKQLANPAAHLKAAS
jgi:ribose transport system substrate-binding protein